MGSPKSLVEEVPCDCRKVGRLGCCNGGNRLSHPSTKVTTNYTRSRSLPTVSRRKRNWRRRFEDALAGAVEQGELSRQAEEVAKVLASHSDKHGKNPWPSHKTVGRQRTISVRSVGRQVAELHDKGWIAVLHRFRPTADGVKGRSNEYLLLIPDGFDIAVSHRPKHTPNRRTEPEQPPAPNADQHQSAPDVVEQWKAVLRAKDDQAVRRLAEEHLEFVPAVGAPLGIGTLSSLAARLADRGPP